MRLAFLGTPDAAVASLRALVDAGHDVAVVITRPDRRRGRGGALSPSPVKAAALELGLRVGHRLSDLDDLDIERGVVVAYGAMIPGAVLERLPMLNVHFSVLPRWRGAAPVERAILAGDETTGVSVMSLEVALDTGPVHLERRTEVGDKTAGELTAELSRLGALCLIEVLASPELLAHPKPQRGEPTYAEKLTTETFHLVPTMSPELLMRTVRLERAFAFVNERRLRVLRAHAVPAGHQSPGSLCVVDGALWLVGDGGAIAVDEVQPEGARPMTAAAWLAGARLDVASARWT
jgi:methionyl-tRNA formyltransferase